MKCFYYSILLVICLSYDTALAQFTKIYDFVSTNDLKRPRKIEPVFDATYMYGAAYSGGLNNLGGVYKIKPDGTNYTKIFDFTGTATGANPYGVMVLSGGVLYGTTDFGGTSNIGCIYSINTDGTGYTKLLDFTGAANGNRPWSGLRISGGVLYGATAYGGASNLGCVFKINTDGTGYTKLLDFTGAANGNRPSDGLTVSGTVIYGTTYIGGTSNLGVLFSMNTDGTGYTKLLDFTGAANGANPNGAMVLSGGVLYGTTYFGGATNQGTFFSINIDGTGYTKLYDCVTYRNGPSTLLMDGGVLYGTATAGNTVGFSGLIFKFNPDGSGNVMIMEFDGVPKGSNTFAGDISIYSGVVYGTTILGGTSNNGCFYKVNLDGTGYVKLLDFANAPDGSTPRGSVTISGSTMYGMTSVAGPSNMGTIFSGNLDGTGHSTLLNFSGTANGSTPRGSLILSGSVLYGMTSVGGANNLGCIFKMNTDGTGYTRMHDFDGATTGSTPHGDLILSGSVLYGMTSIGGTSSLGCIFSINTDGTGYTKLLDFTGAANGSTPRGSLTLSGTTLYGMTSLGGTSAFGCIFSINTDGTGYTKLLDFTGAANGRTPLGALTLSGTKLYGMTSVGGTSSLGCIFSINTDGTGYAKLLDFTGAANGSTPNGSLTLVNGILYGTTSIGGANSLGCLFQINPDGTGYVNLQDFSGTANGSTPRGSLTFFNNYLYGMSSIGGVNSIGTLFKYTNTVLPIELVSFDASYSNQQVNTSWITATETNNDYFNVEKSQDGISFQTESVVKGAGNSSKKLTYTTIDSEPYSGISYYRLKQTDYDGKFTYSQIVPVNSEYNKPIEFSVYPNPVNTNVGDNVSLTLSGLQKEASSLVVLYDVLGKEYYSKIVLTDIGGKVNFVIESSMLLPQGIYLIRAASNNKLFSSKIVIE